MSYLPDNKLISKQKIKIPRTLILILYISLDKKEKEKKFSRDINFNFVILANAILSRFPGSRPFFYLPYKREFNTLKLSQFEW